MRSILYFLLGVILAVAIPAAAIKNYRGKPVSQIPDNTIELSGIPEQTQADIVARDTLEAILVELKKLNVHAAKITELSEVSGEEFD